VHCKSAAVAHRIANGICYHRGAGGGATVLLLLLYAQVGHGTRASNAALEGAGARILGAGRKVPGVAMPAVESASVVESASSGLEDAPAENAAPAPGAMHSGSNLMKIAHDAGELACACMSVCEEHMFTPRSCCSPAESN